jgi:DNA-binding transcriptional LysR family regulator
VVAADSPLAGRRSVGLVELAGYGPFVEMRAESGVRTQVDAAFARAGVERAVAFALDTSEAVVRYVGLGFGAALVPASAADAPDVAVLALDDPQARHPVGLVHRKPQPSAAAARAFLALLHETTR